MRPPRTTDDKIDDLVTIESCVILLGVAMVLIALVVAPIFPITTDLTAADRSFP